MKYEPFAPPFEKEIRSLSKAQLRTSFEWFLEQVPIRVCQLQNAVRSTRPYGHWRADYQPTSLKTMGAWFCESVKDRRLTPKEKAAGYSGPIPAKLLPDRDLTGLTLSLCVDTGIYVGEVLRARHKHLFWHQFLTAKTSFDYGLPVLVEFSVPVNPLRFATVIAYDAVDGKPDPRAFWKQYLVWSKDAKTGVRE